MILHHLYLGISPVLQLNNEESIHNVNGKKIKFTHVAKKQEPNKIKFINKINTASENSGHSRTEYRDPGEINEPENRKNILNFLHLNISSLPYHFSELQTLLSSSKVNFFYILRTKLVTN